MANQENKFNPSYAVPPGWLLEERLEMHDISPAEFAKQCDRSPEFISEIITGKASLDQETAIQFEKFLELPAYIWLGLEERYRLKQARDAEAEAAASVPTGGATSVGSTRRRSATSADGSARRA